MSDFDNKQPGFSDLSNPEPSKSENLVWKTSTLRNLTINLRFKLTKISQVDNKSLLDGIEEGKRKVRILIVLDIYILPIFLYQLDACSFLVGRYRSTGRGIYEHEIPSIVICFSSLVILLKMQLIFSVQIMQEFVT